MNNFDTNFLHKQFEAVKIIKGYRIIGELGRGSFGSVYKVKKDQKIYALKAIKNNLTNSKHHQYIKSEIKIMQQLNDKNCLKIIEYFSYIHWTCLVLEYCNQGSLLTHILKNKPNEENCIKILIQILDGLRAIHQKNYLHRDLKPENIMINNGVFKICDFGLAKLSSQGISVCGTRPYMPPEILQGFEYNYKADLWCLGKTITLNLSLVPDSSFESEEYENKENTDEKKLQISKDQNNLKEGGEINSFSFNNSNSSQSDFSNSDFGLKIDLTNKKSQENVGDYFQTLTNNQTSQKKVVQKNQDQKENYFCQNEELDYVESILQEENIPKFQILNLFKNKNEKLKKFKQDISGYSFQNITSDLGSVMVSKQTSNLLSQNKYNNHINTQGEIDTQNNILKLEICTELNSDYFNEIIEDDLYDDIQNDKEIDSNKTNKEFKNFVTVSQNIVQNQQEQELSQEQKTKHNQTTDKQIPENLQKFLTTEVLEKSYEKEIKTQSRNILDPIFKYFLKQAISNSQRKSLVQQFSKRNNDSYNITPQQQSLQCAYAILLAMLINNITEKDHKIIFQHYYWQKQSIQTSNFQIPSSQEEPIENINMISYHKIKMKKYQLFTIFDNKQYDINQTKNHEDYSLNINLKFSFFDFFIWIKHADKDQISQSILIMLKTAYGKDIANQFQQQYNL
ncbi:Protein kinase-like domain [Pseudocohnilembus persalinus]|uniref:Protein kinase-like domain n=1 Tax=Pseudocohnilembus persalinus TaxID=266149 RepID=A0A0V0QJI2_PSEPJ|nr:Protein kinase-like domain [Pseudocohnilembus persalinus]|eukprot:KRX02425.1 Protein kinase-like domain [Pseudocohnilembus persalinus]